MATRPILWEMHSADYLTGTNEESETISSAAGRSLRPPSVTVSSWARAGRTGKTAGHLLFSVIAWRQNHLDHIARLGSKWPAACILVAVWTQSKALDIQRKIPNWSSWATGQDRRWRRGHSPVKESGSLWLSEST